MSDPELPAEAKPAFPERDRIPGLDFRLEEESQSRRAVELTVPAEVFEAAVQVELRRFRQKAHLRGFRKGKAPRERIERLYGAEAAERASSRLLGRAAKQVLHELDLVPLEAPQVTPKEAAPGGALTARLRFSVYPDIGTVIFDGIKATARKHPVTESDIGETLEQIRMERARPGPIEGRGIQDDDLVVGNLQESDASPDDGASANPRLTPEVALRVGTGAYHQALHEALQGAFVGDTVIATAHFGEHSPDAARAGRTIRATFTITKASMPVLPPLDDEFARSVGANSLLALRGDIRDRLRKRAALDERRELGDQLVAALKKKNPVEPPATFVERELNLRVRVMGNRLFQAGMSREQVKADLEKRIPDLHALCREAVSTAILLDELADQQKIEAAEDALEERLREQAEAERKTVTALRAAMEKDGRLAELRARIRRDAAIDFVKERAEVTMA